jgi:hypothetical protein
MKGASSTSASKNLDPYPGLDAILKKSRKIKPFSTTDLEQRRRALHELVPTGVLRTGVADMEVRMEKDYIRAVSNWRADNWLLPVSEESEFPYSRTKNIGDAGNILFKYGANWLPKVGFDAGSSRPDAILRAAILETNDLRLKSIPTIPDEERPDNYLATLVAMDKEDDKLIVEYDTTKFNRHDEMWKTYMFPGHTITPLFRAFKLFSLQQLDLFNKFKTNPTKENKKALLDHASRHGELLPNLPEHDSYKKAPPKPLPKSSKKTKTVLGNAIEIHDD